MVRRVSGKRRDQAVVNRQADEQIRNLIERVRSQRIVNCCGLKIVMQIDSSLPPGTIKFIAGPRPEQQVTITGIDE